MNTVVCACVHLCATIWGRARRLGRLDRRDIGGAGGTIHHTAETSRHIAGSDVTLEISTNNLYADVSARSRFAGLPIRNNKLTPPRAIVVVRATYICAPVWVTEDRRRKGAVNLAQADIVYFQLISDNSRKLFKKNNFNCVSLSNYKSNESILNRFAQFLLIQPVNYRAVKLYLRH